MAAEIPVRGDAALVLEGGGMRGQYASGAMDFFLQAGIRFPYVIGVSAGISNAASYVAGQFERNRRVFTTFAGDPRYFSWRNWWTQGNPFGMDFIYRELPNHLPFDFAAFAASPARFRIGATDCATGQAVYFDKADAPMTEALLASSSLPMVGRMARVNGRLYLDGGIADPIPVQKAIDDGYDRIVVILTRPKDTVREQKRDIGPATILKRTHPEAAEKLMNRYQTYNDEVALAKEYEKDGRVLILAPESMYGLNTLSKSFEGLERMYRAGYAAAAAIPAFLES